MALINFRFRAVSWYIHSPQREKGEGDGLSVRLKDEMKFSRRKTVPNDIYVYRRLCGFIACAQIQNFALIRRDDFSDPLFYMFSTSNPAFQSI